MTIKDFYGPNATERLSDDNLPMLIRICDRNRNLTMNMQCAIHGHLHSASLRCNLL